MALWMLLGIQLAWVNAADLEPVLTLAPLPEEGDWFLQAPRQVAVGEDGRFFVLDVESYAVFVWKSDGSFLDQFGKQGSGPGEFVFSGRRGGAQGFMTLQKDTLFVFDPAKREILKFSTKDYAYQGATPFQLSRGRPEYCEALPNDQFLVSYRRFSEDGMMRKVGIFNAEGKEVTSLWSETDDTFSMRGSRGSRTFTIKAYSPHPVAVFDPVLGQIVLGSSEAPKFSLFDLSGKKVKTVGFGMPKRKVNDEDKDEFNQQEFIRNSSRVTAEYPEYKAYYDQILALKSGGYLVFNRSPYYRIMDGVVLDKEGEIQARFKKVCGENGDLVGDKGRLFGIITDEEGDFQLQELEVAISGRKS